MPSSPEHALTLHLLRLVRRDDPATESLPKPVADALNALRQAVKTLDDGAFDLLVCDLVWHVCIRACTAPVIGSSIASQRSLRSSTYPSTT